MNNIAYLNGQWSKLEETKVNVLDRGFLFGDGIYEVIPVHHSKPVALEAHIERLQSGLSAIGIDTDRALLSIRTIIAEIIERNTNEGCPYQGLYIQITRGADIKRHHSFPQNVAPTQFAFMFEMASPPLQDRTLVKGLEVGIEQDLRWRRCHIKSTSLLGNVLHFQEGADGGYSETILYNGNNEVTEASACNVFVVINGVVLTAPLDNQLLPGITRQLVIKAIQKHTDIQVEERFFDLETLYSAEEVWLTSSTKEIAPVTCVNGRVIGDGSAGEIWERAIIALSKIKYD